jgi:hypothetical protein
MELTYPISFRPPGGPCIVHPALTFSSTHVRSLSARHGYKRRLQKGLFRNPFFSSHLTNPLVLCSSTRSLPFTLCPHRALTHLLYLNNHGDQSDVPPAHVPGQDGLDLRLRVR